MKKVFTMAFILMVALFMTATGALAATFNVTTESGVRVSEGGTCEQVGSSTMTPANPGIDFWGENTLITVELLRGAVICEEVVYNSGDYIVTAVPGDDFFTILVTTADYGGEIVYGDENSPICFDISDTDYNSTTNQLVRVTYRDTENNSYSGDFVVATVKPSAHEILTCAKAIRDEFPGIGGPIDLKVGTPIIQLCVGETQSQLVGGCGETAGVVCIEITDDAAQFDGIYDFTLRTDKTGVGIADVQAWRLNPLTGGEELLTNIVDRKDSDGNAAEGETLCEEFADTAEIDFTVEMAGVGSVILQVALGYDTNVGASPGALLMDLAFNRIPCGDSASEENIKVADFVPCGTDGDTFSNALLYPYSPAINGYWVGFACTNLSSSPVSVSLVAYEEDGDMYAGDFTIVGNGIYAVNAQNLPLVTLGDDAAWGDERFWIRAFGSGPIDGLLFFGTGSEGMGYLPREATFFDGEIEGEPEL